VKRVIVPFILALIAVLLVGLTPAATAPPAEADEKGFDVVADTVLVNKSGGITIRGWADCTQAVVDTYGSDPNNHPDSVGMNVNWDAYQYLGRGKVIHAQYGSGIQFPCYIKGQTEPPRWETSYPYPDSGTQWVYSPDGKFAPGPIHVEVFGYGGFGDTAIYSFSQYDLRAVRFR